jgi:hypothetical protein
MTSGSSEPADGTQARPSLPAPFLRASFLRASFLRALTRPVVIAGRRWPSIGLLLLAAIGAVLLYVVATTSWQTGSDELAYWRAAQRLVAGQPLYDPNATPVTPYAFWNPPPIAQLLAPLTGLFTPEQFTAAWTVLLLVCLWWLGGRSVAAGLALVAFLPVAVELRTRNMHLVLAVLTVLALRRSWVFWVPATALKMSPILGAVYLLAAGRWRDALKVGVLGLAVLAVSVALSPGAWTDFVAVVGGRAGSDGGALVAVPFWARFALGAVLAVAGGLVTARCVAGRAVRLGPWGLGERVGEVLLVVGLTVANPTLWATALSLLVAVVPLLRTRPPVRVPSVSPTRPEPGRPAAVATEAAQTGARPAAAATEVSEARVFP